MAKPALGRGLGALLGGPSDNTQQPSDATSGEGAAEGSAPAEQEARREAPPGEHAFRVPVSAIYPSQFQPRQDYPAESLQELADSIREQGIIQPLIVRQRGEGYELIAGERRWRAAQQVGLSEAPVIVRETDDHTVLELMLVENLQREDLNPIEEALGYSELMERFQLKQEDVSVKVGKSRTAIANSLRLLKLAPKVQTAIREGHLSVGHAKVILGLNGEEAQAKAADTVMQKGLSVRSTEDLVSQWSRESTETETKSSKGGDSKKTAPRDPHVSALESQLQERLGTKVNLRYRNGKGSVEIRFFSDDDLERILGLVGIKTE